MNYIDVLRSTQREARLYRILFVAAVGVCCGLCGVICWLAGRLG